MTQTVVEVKTIDNVNFRIVKRDTLFVVQYHTGKVWRMVRRDKLLAGFFSVEFARSFMNRVGREMIVTAR